MPFLVSGPQTQSRLLLSATSQTIRQQACWRAPSSRATDEFVGRIRMGKQLATLWLCSMFLIFGGVAAISQTITGSIRGTVTDPSGAVVVGAHVTATNVETGV